MSPKARPISPVYNKIQNNFEEIYNKINKQEKELKSIPQPYRSQFSPVKVNDLKQIRSFDKERDTSKNKYITVSRAEKLINSIFKNK